MLRNEPEVGQQHLQDREHRGTRQRAITGDWDSAAPGNIVGRARRSFSFGVVSFAHRECLETTTS